jgi:DNA repair exonuclease SbcCD nuclease subunit
MQYHKSKRIEDFFDAADKTIDLILEEKPDFVIHTGDLFHKYNPEPGIIRQTIKRLNRLITANIPLYLIRGNHDGSSARSLRLGGTALDLLSEIGSLIQLKDEIIEEENFTIAGMGYYGSKTNARLHDLLKTDFSNLNNESFTILMIHCFVEGQLESMHDLKTFHIEKLKEFDYVALGHFHKEWIDRSARIYCPGSIEHTSSNEWSNPDEDGYVRKRGLFVVEASPPINNEEGWDMSVTPKYFDTRAKKRVNHKLIGKTKEEVHDEIISIIRENDYEEAILNFNFTSNLPSTEQAFFVSSHYEEKATKSLFTKVRITHEGNELPAFSEENSELAIQKIIGDILKESDDEDRKITEQILKTALEHFLDARSSGAGAKQKQKEFIDDILLKNTNLSGEEVSEETSDTSITDNKGQREASTLDNWMEESK